MKIDRFQLLLGTVLLALVVALCVQQSPGWWRGKLSGAEIADYVARAERQLPLPPESKAEFLKRLRAFGEADDGKPLYMLNVIRFYPQVKSLAGLPTFEGTSAEANAKYEEGATPMLLKLGGSVPYIGNVRGQNLFGHSAEVDQWNRVLIVRYTGRRAFLELVTDPAYAPVMPLKLMSMDLLLTPTEVEMELPDLRLAAGALALLAFLATGWWRAARRAD